MKCSGEQSGCDRCRKQSLECHYSIQKPMGRPRKRRERSYDDGDIRPSATESWAGKNSVPAPDTVIPDTRAVPDVQPHACGSFGNLNQHAQSNPFVIGNASYGPSSGELQPDHPAALLTPPNSWSYIPFSLEGTQSLRPANDINGNSTTSLNSYSSPQCTCLSYIYLCLSTISSLSPFPTSSDTLTTLHTAARTAKAAIKCPECPLAFSTSMQNVMLLGTLFNIIGDGWLRVSRSNPRELGLNCAPASYTAIMPQDPDEQQEFWKRWHRQIVRRGVVGGDFDPEMYTPELRCEETPDLLSLIHEMEDRQKMWHEFGIVNFYGQGERKCEALHTNGDTGHDHEGQLTTNKQVEERDFLCLRVVGSARDLLGRFDFQPEDYLA